MDWKIVAIAISACSVITGACAGSPVPSSAVTAKAPQVVASGGAKSQDSPQGIQQPLAPPTAARPSAAELGTDTRPLVVKQFPVNISRDDKMRADEQAANEESKTFVEKWSMAATAVFTVVLALSTGWLCWETRGLKAMAVQQSKDMQVSIDAAKRSADLAERSVAAYATAERAWVAVTGLEPTEVSGRDILGNPAKGVNFVLRHTNAGRTPALVAGTVSSFAIVLADADGGVPHFPWASALEPHPMTVLPNSVIASPAIYVSDADIGRLVAREIRLFLFAAVEYDVLLASAEKRVTETCMEVRFGGTRARSVQGGDSPDGDPFVKRWESMTVGPQNRST